MNSSTPADFDLTFLEEGFSAQEQDACRSPQPEFEIHDSEDAFFVGDLGDVLQKHLRWVSNHVTRAMPRVAPFYAVKCNNRRAVVMTLAALGTGFDCASKTEIQLVQSLGVDPSRIIYANPGKQMSRMKYASAHGVQMMTFDSEGELMKVACCYENPKLVLCIAVNDAGSMYTMNNKFGAKLERCPLLLEQAWELGLDVIGVSFHVGSGCTDPEAYSQAISDARRVFDMGINPALDNPALDKHFPTHSGVRVIAEPGRYYVSSAYMLAVSIIVKKVEIEEKMACDDEGDGANKRTLMYYVNDGINGSFYNILFGARYMPSLHKKPKPDERTYPCSIWGPTCNRLDRIVEQCILPDLQVGEWLLFHNMGAYTIACSTTFNVFQKPDIHYVMSRSAWQWIQQISAQGLPAPVEESCPSRTPSCCRRESSLELLAKPCL
ncbi:ornithine decarboxylase-like [Conger conger]|uniref:ornithine decarboxylase-like n=1 Tax=Conger conger TaxID=82655 RepID=UPI002A5A3908|nr:ornithine decarboxylase-like [Conger conger]